MNTPIRAHMSRPCCARGQRASARPWELYIALPGRVEEWPEHKWPARRTATPTVAERAAALTQLGYESAPGAEWEWWEQETEEWHGHAPHVRLLAALDVRPLGGAVRAAHTGGGGR